MGGKEKREDGKEREWLLISKNYDLNKTNQKISGTGSDQSSGREREVTKRQRKSRAR